MSATEPAAAVAERTRSIATELRARAVRAIAIGGSAGGIDALRVLLAAWPRIDVPVLVALHLSAEMREDRWSLVFAAAAATVREAEDKELALGGHVYIAPADYHLLVDAAGGLVLSADPPVHRSRPSIDVLLESAAWAYRERLLGIVLSGANADGADGLAAIRRMGGLCWVQSPEDAPATTMPRAALQAVPDAHVLSLKEMASLVKTLGGVQ